MQSLPANSGSVQPNGESDLEAILARIAPERRADFLRWRERIKRHGDNDELLALVGYLDTSVVLMDLLTREAQPEAIKQALAAVEKASKDQAAATARIPPFTLVLNTATLIITAVLGMAIGVLIMVLHQTHIDQEHAKTPERVGNTNPPPTLIIGQLRLGNPIQFTGKQELAMRLVPSFTDLWEIPAADCNLTD